MNYLLVFAAGMLSPFIIFSVFILLTEEAESPAGGDAPKESQ